MLFPYVCAPISAEDTCSIVFGKTNLVQARFWFCFPIVWLHYKYVRVYVNGAKLVSHCPLLSLRAYVSVRVHVYMHVPYACVQVCVTSYVKNVFPISSCSSEKKSAMAGFTASWEEQVERTSRQQGSSYYHLVGRWMKLDRELLRGLLSGQTAKAKLVLTFLSELEHNQNPELSGNVYHKRDWKT